MASTFTTALGIEKQGVGDNDGTWGTTLNTQFDLFEDAICGMTSVALVDGVNNLSINNGTSDQRRFNTLWLHGALTAATEAKLPAKEGFHVVTNYTTGGQEVKINCSGGSGFVVPVSTAVAVFCDGVSVYPCGPVTFKDGSLNLSGTSVAAFTVGTLTAANVSATARIFGTEVAAVTASASAIKGTTLALTGTGTAATFAAEIVSASAFSGRTVSATGIGVSVVDATCVSAGYGYFDNLAGGTVAINAYTTIITTPVSISAFATSLSAGTGFGVGSITFTPRSTASRFLIQAHVPVATSVPDSNIYTALFSSNSATAIQQTKTYNAAISQSLIHPLVGVLSPNTVSPVVVSIRAAKSGLNTGLVNEGNTPTLITVTEFNS